jgi:large subunit ribosomal protein L21
LGQAEKARKRVYAIVQTGGRQFRVEPEKTFRIPKLDVAVGGMVELDQVLLVEGESGVSVGQPRVKGAKVVAEVVAQGREAKILVFHKKRRPHAVPEATGAPAALHRDPCDQDPLEVRGGAGRWRTRRPAEVRETAVTATRNVSASRSAPDRT